MKIPCFTIEDKPDKQRIFCPSCNCTLCRGHGSYTRKGFHRRNKFEVIVVEVQRYRCQNENCLRCTFSVLPAMVVRYSRFFWPTLLAIGQSLATGVGFGTLANLWHVTRRVIKRAAALLNHVSIWVGHQYQELTEGKQPSCLEGMVKIIVRKLGRTELLNRWYHHRYPARLSYKSERHTIRIFSVNER